MCYAACVRTKCSGRLDQNDEPAPRYGSDPKYCAPLWIGKLPIEDRASDEGRGHRPESVTRHLRRPSTMTAGGAVAATAETTGVGMEPLMATTAERIDITAADAAGCIGTP